MRKLILLLTIAVTFTACQNDRFEALEEANLLQTRVSNHLHGEIADLQAELDATALELQASIDANTALIAENTEATVSNLETIGSNYDALVAADAENLEAITKTVNDVETNLSAAIEDEVVLLNETIAALKVELQLAIADGDQNVVNILTVQIEAAEVAAATAVANINFPSFDASGLTTAIAALDARVIINTDELATIKSNLEFRLGILEQFTSDNKAQLTSISTLLGWARTDIQSLEAAVALTATEADVTLLEVQIAAAELVITGHTSSLIELRTYINSQVAVAYNQALTATNEVTRAHNRIDALLLLPQITTAQIAEITALRTDLTDLNTDVTSNTTALNGIDVSTLATASGLAAVAADMANIIPRVNDHNVRLINLTTALGFLEGRVGANEDDIDDIEATLVPSAAPGVAYFDLKTPNNATDEFTGFYQWTNGGTVEEQLDVYHIQIDTDLDPMYTVRVFAINNGNAKHESVKGEYGVDAYVLAHEVDSTHAVPQKPSTLTGGVYTDNTHTTTIYSTGDRYLPAADYILIEIYEGTTMVGSSQINVWESFIDNAAGVRGGASRRL